MGAGCELVFMDKWDSETVLRTIADKRVTHMHLVPIMFQRLLALPDEVKAKYDISHVKYIVHGAAPCPPEVKLAMIEWFGPVLNEYYAGSEGGAGFVISAEEWLKKPGSVGKRPALLGSKILDEQGNECPPGVPGTIYHQLPPGGGFTYYKDEAKTQANRVGDYFTLGDVGYFDEDGYLFLTGRNAETIISGGVNIYPQEIDNELIKHEAVADCSTVGVPHDEWGEQVKAVIMLKEGYRRPTSWPRRSWPSRGPTCRPSRSRAASTSSPTCPAPKPARSSATRSARPTGKAARGRFEGASSRWRRTPGASRLLPPGENRDHARPPRVPGRGVRRRRAAGRHRAGAGDRRACAHRHDRGRRARGDLHAGEPRLRSLFRLDARGAGLRRPLPGPAARRRARSGSRPTARAPPARR